MASRMKEDERNEKIIRGLLKLPANRRCINCNNLGPQYVCTNFWTFICTNCSGLQVNISAVFFSPSILVSVIIIFSFPSREFCHRVKSISMAKFTAQEVTALQEGGNEKAKEIYFKEWDLQRNSLPDSSNSDRLRDFIKHVYVDRRFTGERNTDRPLRAKADPDDSNERSGDSYRGDSRSPPYDDRYRERLGTSGRNGNRNIRFVYGERSPGYDQSDKRSPRRFEVVDDRVRDDRYGIHRFEDRRLPHTVTKHEGSSPSRQKDMSSPPVVHPVRDILGDDTSQLRIDDTPKSNNGGIPDSSAPMKGTSSSSMGSTDGNSVQLKTVNSGSLIDFTADPEPPVAAAPHQPIPQQNISPPSNGGDWASFDNAAQQKAPPVAANSGSLESALSQLSTPGPAPLSQVATLPTSGVGAYPKTNDMGQWPTTQQHQTSLFPADLSQSRNLPFNAPVAGGQSWESSAVQSTQETLSNSGAHLSQVATKPRQETSAGFSSQPASVEAEPTGRKELPADLFTALYSSAPVSVPGWQRGPYPGIRYGMQYPMGMPQTMPTFPHSSKSANPFDVGSEPALAHTPTFPSMSTLQGALPHVAGPSPLLRSSSLGNPLQSQWVPPQQSSFRPAMPLGQYMMQQQAPGNVPQLLHNNMVIMGHQGTGGPGSPAALLGNLGTDQLPTGRYSLPNTPFSSAGGNPFG